MPSAYGRDLDLNLLRVFAVVAETGSVTVAASRLYLTQPAVSAAVRRLTAVVGAPLFARSGRGLVLTSRGQRLRDGLEPHLQKIIDAALDPPTFDPRTSERTFRLGLTDSAELWLLPRLLRALEKDAPEMSVVSLPVQFRTVAAALAGGLDAAVTVADELSANIRREPLFADGFTCLYDARHARLGTLTEKEYFARPHVIVSYNGDLRGIVEDVFHKTRSVRCSVPSFAHVGALIEGTAMLATVPQLVADQIRAVRPHLEKKPLPFTIKASNLELLWPVATDDDEPCRFLRAKIIEIARQAAGDRGRPDPPGDRRASSPRAREKKVVVRVDPRATRSSVR
jgi:LysR family transcriptional activator of mexEF-oprN operon